MTKTTLADAKTQLDALVDAALRGERVVITRGSKPVAAIVPADEAPALRVSNAAADYLAHEARTELEDGVAQVHESPAAFAATITKPRRRT
ncbi:MAG: type II toxin-antitoxin system Phd/YefM family antitoxin [Verrucomicrobia bacterium]|nr:type II toxin-antitoxin system Phd/YefM family antitoxin [Verrucomicrobiota bacterium]